jgi:uncharacterized protein
LTTWGCGDGNAATWLTGNGQSVLIDAGADLERPAPELVETLTAEGILTDMGHLYGATVMLTTRCNLSCSYCYQNESMEGEAPVRIQLQTLTPDRLAEVRDFVATQMRTYSKSALHVLLTGGEPLLQYRSCELLLEGLGPLGMVAAQMFTNAVLLTTDRARGLSAAGLTSLQVSFDGFSADHDRYRKDAAGTGSYERIVANIAAALDAVPQLAITARVNVTTSNVDRLHLLLEDLDNRVGAARLTLRLGLIDDIGIGFADAPARDLRTGNRVRDLAVGAVERGFTVDPLATVADCLYCGIVGGGSGTVINADGTLYSCWESVGRTGYEVGDLRSGYLSPDQLEGRWVDCSYNVVDRERTRSAISQICDEVDAAVLDRRFELLSPLEVTA